MPAIRHLWCTEPDWKASGQRRLGDSPVCEARLKDIGNRELLGASGKARLGGPTAPEPGKQEAGGSQPTLQAALPSQRSVGNVYTRWDGGASWAVKKTVELRLQSHQETSDKDSREQRLSGYLFSHNSPLEIAVVLTQQ